MKVYKKEALSSSASYRREQVALGGEQTLGFEEAGGELRAGMGGKPLFSAGELPEGGAEAAFCAGGAWALYSGGAVCVRTSGSFAPSLITFSDMPRAARIFDGGDALLLWDGETSAILSAEGLAAEELPAFDGAAYFGDRLWTAKGMRLSYSAPDDVRDFSQERGKGGYIDSPSRMGNIVALAAGTGELFLFRERGLQALSGRGEERGFVIRDLLECAPVYGATAAFDGRRAVWLSEDGPHAYGGEDIFGDAAKLYARAAQDAPRGCASGGKYYLQARVRAGGEEFGALARFGEEGRCILPVAVTGLSAGETAYFCTGGVPCCAEGENFPGGAKRLWRGKMSAPFGGRCTLAQLRMRARGGVELRAESEEGTRVFRLYGRGELREMRVSLPGREFRFCAAGEDGAEVLRLEAVYERGCAK